MQAQKASKLENSSRISLKVVSDAKGLTGLRSCWESWQYDPNSDLGQFELICGLRPEILSPYVVVVEDDGNPCALMLSRIERTFVAPRIGYVSPLRIKAVVLTVIYEGLIGNADPHAARMIVQHLWSLLKLGTIDAVTFHHIREDSLLLQVLMAYAPAWWCEKKPAWVVHRSMILREDPDFLMNNLRSKHRSRLRKKQLDLDKAFKGKVSWEWITQFNDIPGLCARLDTIAALTYQRALKAGFVNDEEHRQRFELFAGRGQLRVQLLEIDGKIRAFWIGIIYRNVFHSWATGYDPDLRAYEIGTLVFLRMVSELVNEGVRKFDFGLGDAGYKERFGDASWREANLTMFAPNGKGFALRSSIGLCSLLDQAGRQFLERIGLFDRLKTGWRRRLSHQKENGEE